MKLIGGTVLQPSRKCDFGYASDAWFNAELSVVEPNRVISSAGSSSVTVNDANLTRHSSGSFAVDRILKVDVLPRTYGTAPTKNLTGNGFVQFANSQQVLLESLGNGNGSLALVTPNRTVNLTVPGQLIGTQTDVLSSWATGSLMKSNRDAIITLLASVTPPAGLTANTFVSAASLFTTKETGAGAGVAVRNTAHWLNTLPLSGFSTWSSYYGSQWQMCAVSQRHLINASHVGYGAGMRVWFCSQDGNNTRTYRTVTSYRGFNLNGVNADIGIATLDSDLPNWVTPFKVMPANWLTVKAPSLNLGAPFPFITQDQFASILITTGAGDTNIRWRPTRSGDLDYTECHPYSIFPRYGDSGQPLFAVINGELVLLACASTSQSGAVIHPLISAINAEMALAGSYSLTQVNLSGFNSY